MICVNTGTTRRLAQYVVGTSYKELPDVVRDMISSVFPRENISKILKTIENLEKIRDLTNLTRYLG